MTQPAPLLRVGFVLAHRFTLSAFASFVDVLRLAADEGDRSRPIKCSWRVLSASGDLVTSSCGVPVRPDERLGDPTRFDYIVVVGGVMEDHARLDPQTLAFLHRAAEAGVALVGVCTGAFILHRAGLMQGYRCCVSWFHHDDFLEQFEGLVPISDQIFVVDGPRLTCSGGVSSAHLAAYLVERHLSREAARKSLSIMIIDEAMGGDRPQPGLPIRMDTRDPLVKRALLILQQSLDTPIPVGELAARIGVSRRKLERRFASALEMSPAQAGLAIRVGVARQLLERSGRSVTQIANDTGFSDVSHFIRSFRRAQGTTPEAWRQAARAAS